LGMASFRGSNWPDVISDARARYSGKLTCAALCNMEPATGEPVTPECHGGWWSGLDYIGVNAYYHVTPGIPNPTLQQLKDGWVTQAQRIDTWWHALPSDQQKPLVFSEVGVESVDTPESCQYQADYYEAMFSALWGKYDWFKGTDYYAAGVAYYGPDATDYSWSVDGRPAEAVIRSYYALPEPSALVLLVTALLGALAYAWRRRK
jgi:hypothetical protein